MAHILVVFGTTDGQTARIAARVADVLRTQGHTVDLVDTRSSTSAVSLAGIGAVIAAASLRMGKFQKELVRFVREHAGEWNG